MTSAIGRRRALTSVRQAAWCLGVGIGLCVSVASAPAQTDAGRPQYSQADWALLPEWCIDTQDGPFGSPSYSGESKYGRSKSPRSDQWTGIFGSDFWHMHHYCRGLYATYRLQRATTPKERVAALEVAIDEYRYVVRQCAPTMPLLPEVYLRMGEMYLRKDDKTLASDAFAMARQLKPDYWPAYTRWADELVSLRLFERARDIIDEGLRHSPQEAELLQRRAQIAERISAPGRGKVAQGRPAAASGAAAARKPQ